MRKHYPGIAEAEKEQSKRKAPQDAEPDFVAGAPNYDKFHGWSPEEVLIWLNID